MNDQPLFEIIDLSKIYRSRKGAISGRPVTVRALDGVSFSINRQQTLGVVGESGCGKTTLGRVILRLINPSAGQIIFEGEDLVQMKPAELRRKRRDMQMVFQNPFSSFDPHFSVLNAIGEPLRTHTTLRGKDLEQRALELLSQVGMPGEILYRYPHEFSGGQLQRIAVARALALNPKFIVLDEPTSALDVSVQAQIINLLQSLQAEMRLTYLFISHDLSIVQHISDHIAVMYLGKIVEMSTSENIFFGRAQHPYTKALLSSAPLLDPALKKERIILQGNVPDPADPPLGCSFHPRCPVAIDICSRLEPPLIEIDRDHLAACHLIEKRTF